MAKTNKEIIKQVVDHSSLETKERLSQQVELMEAGDTGAEFFSVMESYPTSKNEFFDLIFNKIVKQQIWTRVYENPLKTFNRGVIPYGETIENVFIKQMKRKGAKELFHNADIEAEELRTLKPEVEVFYSSINLKAKYKVTLERMDLRQAFMSVDGLSNFINQVIGEMISSEQDDEYQDIKNLIHATAQGGYLQLSGTGLPVVTPIPSGKGVNQPLPLVEVGPLTNATASTLNQKVREFASKMTFRNDAYNMSKVRTHTPKSDLIWICDPESQSMVDVNVLAQAFNKSSADINVETVIIDELPTLFNKSTEAIGTLGTGEAKCYGILCDRMWLQHWVQMKEMATTPVASNLTTNHFYHVRSSLSALHFMNAIAFVDVKPV